MRNRLLLLVLGPTNYTSLEPVDAKSLLLDWLPGDLVLCSNHWCLSSELAARECSKETDKVSGFHSLRVSGGDEISLLMPSLVLGIVSLLLGVTSGCISIITGWMLMASPGGLSSAHSPGTSKGISGPFKAVFAEWNLRFFSREWWGLRP
jgi:hypothetical protein